ncbi:serine hydrolase domain-containing protein [Mycetocola spongiae]|uniref:serine hydrolase domain-containing protein n=1 Tax=Mycetocola spongiae TaxID=2859226 RepID=UPI001CF4AB3A|nr:serine hydrolase domain-containing protein [Mycetocola spongiae]UCR89632.1 beta-lactamase family protein [Mycetocola spongiae]
MSLAATTPSRTPRTAAQIHAILAEIWADPASHNIPGRIPGSALAVAGITPAGERIEFLRGTTSAGYSPGGEADRPGIPITADTRFDLASLSKLFIAVTALSVIDAGLIDPDAPVAPILAVGSGPGAPTITLRQLLAHSSGLPATTTLWESIADPGELWARVLGMPLARLPEAAHEYSCIGYDAIGVILERVTGRDLGTLVTERVLRPLGTRFAGYGPVDPADSVATEIQPHRGLVWGSVHDELAHGLGRVAGNSGLFAPASDALLLGEMIINDGMGSGGRVLSAEAVRMLSTPEIFSENAAGRFGQAAGFRVGDAEFMGAVPGLGHTGFTGTMLTVNPRAGSAVVLLTNRVHPGRARANVFPLQRAVSELVCL